MESCPRRKKKDRWKQGQFNVSITQKYSDGAYKTIRFDLNGVPGVVAVDQQDGSPELILQHTFLIVLPRQYPQKLADIKIINNTPLHHPRILGTGSKACYTVNGEVDRILVDIIYNVLMRPETVRPPSQFKDADWGLDSLRMQWYIKYGPKKIYEELKAEWGRQQNNPRKKIQIID